MTRVDLDDIDRRIVNGLQGGFPLSERPYAEAAERLGLSEDVLLDRLRRLVDAGALSRFGPLYNAERLGGAVTLAAMSVPDERFEVVAEQVNARREIAHNYARNHRMNMWFVVACEDPAEIAQVLADIAEETGLAVYNFPKEEEFFIGLRVEA